MKKLHKITVVLSLLLGLFSHQTQVFADEGTVQGLGFQADWALPDSQHSDSAFWDLLLAPNSMEQVEVTLSNTSPAPIIIDMEIVGARTTDLGEINYSPNEGIADETMPHDIRDVASVPAYIELGVGEEQTITVNLAMPSEEFNGMLLGSLHLQRRLTEEETQGEDMIINTFSFIIGLVLRNNTNATDKDIYMAGVEAGLDNFRTAVLIDLINRQPEILPDMTIRAEVFQEGQEVAVFERTQAEMRMAPNTSMRFPVRMGDQAIQPGTYIVRIHLTSEDDVWSWEETFTITEAEASNLNSQAVGFLYEGGSNLPPLWMIGAGVGTLLFIGLILSLVKNKNSKGTGNFPGSTGIEQDLEDELNSLLEM